MINKNSQASEQTFAEIDAMLRQTAVSQQKRKQTTHTRLVAITAVIQAAVTQREQKKALWSGLQLATASVCVALFLIIWFGQVRWFSVQNSDPMSFTKIEQDNESYEPFIDDRNEPTDMGEVLAVEIIGGTQLDTTPPILDPLQLPVPIHEFPIPIEKPAESIEQVLDVNLLFEPLDPLDEIDGFHLFSGCEIETVVQSQAVSLDQEQIGLGCTAHYENQLTLTPGRPFTALILYENKSDKAVQFQLFHAPDAPLHEGFQIAPLAYECQSDSEDSTLHNVHTVGPQGVWMQVVTFNPPDDMKRGLPLDIRLTVSMLPP